MLEHVLAAPTKCEQIQNILTLGPARQVSTRTSFIVEAVEVDLRWRNESAAGQLDTHPGR